MSDAQSQWENQRDIDCAEHNQPRCPKFPDHDCEECHSQHIEEHDFNPWCQTCKDEKCEKCNGEGYIGEAMDEIECAKCKAAGRV